MTRRPPVSTRQMISIGGVLMLAACSTSGGGRALSGTGGGHGGQAGATSSGAAGAAGATGSSAGATGNAAGSGGQSAGGSGGGQVAGTTGIAGQPGGGAGSAGGPGGAIGTGGRAGADAGAAAGRTGDGGALPPPPPPPGDAGPLVSSCTGRKDFGTADPTTMGPFAITTDKNVGPLAGNLPDPVYSTQQRFNVYRPQNLSDGYCHPILVWNNGHTDNPEPNPPECVTGGGKYCGSYLVLMKQMASHGFVVIASLSTITSQPDPMNGNQLPNIVGLNWLLQQAEDASTPYYHHLDTAHIGAFGHSEGGLSTCLEASDPRITAIATVSGTRANPGIHQPALFFCGDKDTTVKCSSVMSTYASVTDYPAMFIDNLSADHGGWLYQNGAKGPDIFGLTAWFRVQLMGDTGNRKYFYGSTCTFCTDTRVTVMRNSFLTQ